MSECSKCGFVGCICRRGEREPLDIPHVAVPEPAYLQLKRLGTPTYEQKEEPMANREAFYGNIREHLTDVHSAYPEAMLRDAPKTGAKKSGPGSRYVEVPAEAIAAKLVSMGFEQTRIGGEIAFERVHKMCKHTKIVVNTSIPVNGSTVRALGEDAIHVLAIFEKPWKGRPFKKIVARGTRIHRSGSVEAVLERIYERAREVYQAATDSLKDPKTTCFECCKQPRQL